MKKLQHIRSPSFRKAAHKIRTLLNNCFIPLFLLNLQQDHHIEFQTIKLITKDYG